MKRTIAYLLTVLLILMLFSGCNKTSRIPENTVDTSHTTENSVNSSETLEITERPNEEDLFPIYSGNYIFGNLDDFYLYAEQFEQDLSKYKEKPGTGKLNDKALYFRQVQYLVKLEELFPDLKFGEFNLSSVRVNGYTEYIYTFDNDMEIKVKTSPYFWNFWWHTPGAMVLHDYEEKVICELKASFEDPLYVLIRIPTVAHDSIKNSSSTELKKLLSDDNNIVREQLDIIAKRFQDMNLQPYFDGYVTS